jgi:hypothetical protein
MNARWLFFLVICCAVVTPAIIFAASHSPTPQQTSSECVANTISDHPQDAGRAARADGGKREREGNPFGERRNLRHLSGKDHPNSPASTVKNHAKQIPKNRHHSPSGNTLSAHQLGPDKSLFNARPGLMQHGTANAAVPRGQPSVVRPGVPALNKVRHHGANPPVIGGEANSDGKHTAVIDGTRMHRRP